MKSFMTIKAMAVLVVGLSLLAMGQIAFAQTTIRPRPTEWNNLVYGGRFMDRFLPMPNLGPLRRDTCFYRRNTCYYRDSSVAFFNMIT